MTSFFPEVGVGAAAAACLGCCLSSVSRSTPEANLFPVGRQHFAVERPKVAATVLTSLDTPGGRLVDGILVAPGVSRGLGLVEVGGV